MNYKHGHAAGGFTSRTYKSWEQMLHRCKYHLEYAGRGIRVDPRWTDFREFLADMGECPPRLTLDRIDNDGGYSKGNCRWTTRAVQNANQRKRRQRTTRHGNAVLTDAEVTAILMASGSHQSIADAYGISRSMVSMIKRGARHKHITAR